MTLLYTYIYWRLIGNSRPVKTLWAIPIFWVIHRMFSEHLAFGRMQRSIPYYERLTNGLFVFIVINAANHSSTWFGMIVAVLMFLIECAIFASEIPSNAIRIFVCFVFLSVASFSADFLQTCVRQLLRWKETFRFVSNCMISSLSQSIYVSFWFAWNAFFVIAVMFSLLMKHYPRFICSFIEQ